MKALEPDDIRELLVRAATDRERGLGALKVDVEEDALEFLKSYWGGMAKDGADTFWEIYVPTDNSVSSYEDPLINSFCHAWSCSPSYFIRKYFVEWEGNKQ